MFLQIDKMYAFFKLQFKKAFVYRMQFISSIVISPIILLLYYSIWNAVYMNSSTGTIMGYSFDSMMMYYIISMIVGHFIFNMVGNKIQQRVVLGELTRDLLKPADPRIQFISIELSERVFALFSEVIPVLIISILIFNIKTSMANAAFFSITMILAFFINYFIGFLMGLISFWMLQIESIQWLMFFGVRFLSGEYMPLEIISPVFLQISRYLPFYYVRYGVVQIFLDRFSIADSAKFLMIQLIWIILLMSLGNVIWNRAIKRFGAVGG